MLGFHEKLHHYFVVFLDSLDAVIHLELFKSSLCIVIWDFFHRIWSKTNVVSICRLRRLTAATAHSYDSTEGRSTLYDSTVLISTEGHCTL